ncbi:hypothetical protein ABPG74_013570 [Tetrahymena malaccensis]
MNEQLPNIFGYRDLNPLSNLNEVVKLQQEVSEFSISTKESIQICFLVDATGSMDPYVDKVRQEIDKICQSIKQVQQNDLKIYVSMVAYRDRTDEKCMEKIGFTENLDEFQTFIRSLNYEGGGDECEDVQIGLKEVINLEWKQNSLNLLIWIADSPCHGEEFHDDTVNDHYPEDSGEVLKNLFKQICEKDIDIYFYKIDETTNKMIQILNGFVFKFDKQLKQQQFQDSNFSQNVLKSYFNSQSDSAFGEFFKYVKQLSKTNQLPNAQKIKQQIKDYQQKIIIQSENFEIKDFKLNQLIQEDHITNIDDIDTNETEFTCYKFKLNKNVNKIELEQKQSKTFSVSQVIIGQGAFKETYLAQDQKSGNLYALKKFKESNQFDFDNFLIEYYIQLIAENIRDDFIDKLKKKTEKALHKELKIFFDEQLIVQDESNNQFYMMELAKNGFKKYINNDQTKLNTQNKNQQELFQSFLHYSFEFSNYDFILSDIQGFGNTLNDISIHSQKFIDQFKTNEEPQLQQQFFNNQSVNMQEFEINTPIYSNMGNLGIVLFFNQHKCNKYCKYLDLQTFDSYKSVITNQKINKTHQIYTFTNTQQQNNGIQQILQTVKKQNADNKQLDQITQTLN